MPVHRLRTLDQAAGMLWRTPDDPALPREVAEVWRLGEWLAPWSLPPGVHRFRSVDALGSQRREWERTRVRPRFRRAQDVGAPAGPNQPGC